ncbi:hypothetical protein [Microbacterium jejuense]|uniref:hypothetical protein n=1 Tax=Microbacterium jejuense TaxID=1263637 RepID=UPI0031EE8659
MTPRDRAGWLHGSPEGTRSTRVHHERVAQGLLAAAAAGDARGMERMLHPGAALTVDGGGHVPAPGTTVEGATDVAACLADVLLATGTTLRIEAVNGLPGIIVCRRGAVVGILGLRVRGRQIIEAWLIVNPDKLTRWNCD